MKKAILAFVFSVTLALPDYAENVCDTPGLSNARNLMVRTTIFQRTRSASASDRAGRAGAA